MLRHFTDTQELSLTEIRGLFELIRCLKAADKAGAVPRLLPDASLAMIFEEPSTRTRISFEAAMTRLGGHALYLKPGEIHLGERESVADTARVISRMCDCIEARTLKHETLLELARHATVPVINGLTDFNHPTQALCDIFTISEHIPAGRGLQGLRFVFVGDATNVLSSDMFLGTRLGMHIVHAAPERYQAPKAWLDVAAANCRESGGSVTVTEDVEAAVAEADVVYTDLWWWIGQEAEIPDRSAAFMPRYQVNSRLMSLAPAHCLFMHCLPASRGVEVTDDVIDGPRSIVFDQSENRLYTEMALLVWLVYPRLPRPDEGTIRRHQRDVGAVLAAYGWNP